MEFTGWGRYPSVEADTAAPYTSAQLRRILTTAPAFQGIARGLGRSYGDSALAPRMIGTTNLDNLIAFDGATGQLTCGAGLTLDELLKVFVPRGWFLPVTPGTKFVTVGGAIANDVHGKNHHREGCFSNHLESLRLMLADGEIVNCSHLEHAELFQATCGGIGLTGVILDATITLKPIQSSLLRETILTAGNLEEMLDLFAANADASHSVAWLDCLATGTHLGRSLLILGSHMETGSLIAHRNNSLSLPIDMPGLLMNRFAIQAFNTLYYRNRPKPARTVHYDGFFYPLDKIRHWNRIYGKQGFVQYQLVLPRAAGSDGLSTLLRRITAARRGSFLAVLKAFGPANQNYLSFPIDGYTLALDFKIDAELFVLLDELDHIVLDYGGRLYLAKDSRMSAAVFKRSYPAWEKFMEVRLRYGAERAFNSLQSDRRGLRG
jgi:FAD/FMN-containing dehydrogenase